MIGVADRSTTMSLSLVANDALPGLRDRMRMRRSKTSPSAYPLGERRGHGLTELLPLKDAPDTTGVLVDARGTAGSADLASAVLQSADRSPVTDQGILITACERPAARER